MTPAFSIVKIVSESTSTADCRVKVSEYQTIGIPEYWIVDPEPLEVSTKWPMGIADHVV